MTHFCKLIAVAMLAALPLTSTADIPGGGPRTQQPGYQSPPDSPPPDPAPPVVNPPDSTVEVTDAPAQSTRDLPVEVSHQRLWISLLLGAIVLGGGVAVILRSSRTRSH
jgi:hypothetical protein